MPAVKPSPERASSCSASGCTPARSRIADNGTPSQRAVPMRSPPAGLWTQTSVASSSLNGIVSSSPSDSDSCWSTMPCTRRRQVSGSTCGTGIWTSVT
jgi:hypothetical protein